MEEGREGGRERERKTEREGEREIFNLQKSLFTRSSGAMHAAKVKQSTAIFIKVTIKMILYCNSNFNS